jgi:UDP-GlcNAc:undecaprenyl-phosphate GlcNAc-1-phosphate transferase
VRLMLQLIQQQSLQILTVVLFTIILNLILKSVAHKVSLVDKPNARKTHQDVIPLIGGISIFLACSLSLFTFDDIPNHDLRTMVVVSGLFLFLGVLDDQFDIKANVKLLTQITISFMFAASTGFQISNFSSLLGVTYSLELGFLSLPFTILAIVGLTNAFNMIDGCDGLAAALAALAILALLYLGSSHFELSTQTFLLMLVASIFTFLLFNFSNNSMFKVFLGDGGSLFLGFIVSALLIKFAKGNETYASSIVLWFVAVPVYDFCTVVVRRLLLKRKIMSADRSHIHHYLLSLGLSHFQTTMVILCMAIVIWCFGVFLEANYPSLSLLAFVGLFAVYLSLRLLNRRN